MAKFTQSSHPECPLYCTRICSKSSLRRRGLREHVRLEVRVFESRLPGARARAPPAWPQRPPARRRTRRTHELSHKHS